MRPVQQSIKILYYANKSEEPFVEVSFEEPVFYDTVWSSIPVGFNGKRTCAALIEEKEKLKEHACVLTDVSPLFVFRS